MNIFFVYFCDDALFSISGLYWKDPVATFKCQQWIKLFKKSDDGWILLSMGGTFLNSEFLRTVSDHWSYQFSSYHQCSLCFLKWPCWFSFSAYLKYQMFGIHLIKTKLQLHKWWITLYARFLCFYKYLFLI